MIYQVKSIAEFDKYVKENEKVVVDVYATWCGPCKMLAPVLEDASSQRRNITFLKVDCDSVSEVSERYDVLAVPTILFFKDGKLIGDCTGYRPLEDILQEIDLAFK